LMVQGLLELVRGDAFLLEEELADADSHVSLVVSLSRANQNTSETLVLQPFTVSSRPAVAETLM